jgi:hypothetical protein
VVVVPVPSTIVTADEVEPPTMLAVAVPAPVSSPRVGIKDAV